jgi:hypothetical protein
MFEVTIKLRGKRKEETMCKTKNEEKATNKFDEIVNSGLYEEGHLKLFKDHELLNERY